MLCIPSVSYSIIINGEACGNVIPSRRIRQGDPLSPYLFHLCADGFSALIHKAARVIKFVECLLVGDAQKSLISSLLMTVSFLESKGG